MGVIYPDIISTSIQLRSVLNIIEECYDDSHNMTCTVVITRDVYRVTVIQFNGIGDTSTEYPEDIDSKTYCVIFIINKYILKHS